MDVGTSTRAQGSAVDARVVRYAAIEPRGTSRTELGTARAVAAPVSGRETGTRDPSAKAVENRTEAERARNAARERDAVRETTEREVVFDPQTRDVIFRVLDVRTGDVVRQIPEETIMKIRAYNTGEGKAAEKPAEPSVERKA